MLFLSLSHHWTIVWEKNFNSYFQVQFVSHRENSREQDKQDLEKEEPQKINQINSDCGTKGLPNKG